jgi:hypothetical protein
MTDSAAWEAYCATLTYGGDIRHGIIFVRVFGYGLALHMPWKAPLFSERNGLRKMWGAYGWRVEWLRRSA